MTKEQKIRDKPERAIVPFEINLCMTKFPLINLKKKTRNDIIKALLQEFIRGLV